jgi:hypothetical protein
MQTDVSPRTERREKEGQACDGLAKLLELSRDRNWHGRVGVLIDIKAGKIDLITHVHETTTR